MINQTVLTYPKILKFWAPLALMWIVMAIEMPAINAVIARMAEAKENLAIFGVVFSISLIIEGPIIQMLSAATAISTSYANYKRLSKFMFYILIALTAIHIICCIPPIFGFIAKYILNLDEAFIRPGYITLLIMIPWTPAIGYRRMWQGVLIRDGRTYSVTAIMILRIIATFLVLFIGFFYTNLRGSYIAAASLTIGVTAGTVFAGIFAKKTISKKKLEDENSAEPVVVIPWSNLYKFYTPLALTSFVTMANRPIISAGITRGLFPLESLAAWPVVISIVHLFQSFSLSFQEVSIALISDEKSNTRLRKTILTVGIISVVLYVVAVLTPSGKILFFSTISGLNNELISIAVQPLLIMAFVSFASPAIAWFRAVNIRKETTGSVAIAVIINLSVVTVTIFLLNYFLSITGIMAAAISYTAAVLAEAIYLFISSKQAGKKELALK